MQCIECCQGKTVGNQEMRSMVQAAQACLGLNRWSQAHGEGSSLNGGYCCETLALAGGELHVVDAAKHCRISCMAGVLWVTTSSRAADYILKAGECLLLQGRSKIIITGYGKNCQVRISRG
jgi:hypothetical protein